MHAGSRVGEEVERREEGMVRGAHGAAQGNTPIPPC